MLSVMENKYVSSPIYVFVRRLSILLTRTLGVEIKRSAGAHRE